MKSTTKASISGIAFNLENDAYTCLQKYLERIEKTFASKEEGREIVEDIEVRIAELFSARIQSPEQVITLTIVNEVLTIIGTAEDIAGNDNQTTQQQVPPQNKIEEPAKKRLYRDIDHRVIGGVCSGLGNYFGIGRVWVRLAFVLATIVFSFWGLGSVIHSGTIILLYIILWIVMPAARTMQEKMTMRKEPIIPSSQYSHNEHNMYDPHHNDFGFTLGRVIGGFFRVIGWFVLVIMAFVALALIFALPIGLVTGNAMIGELGYINFSGILQSYTYIPTWLASLLVMFVVCIPLIAVIYGLCKLLFRFKSKIRIGLVLFIIWSVSLLSLVGITTYIATQYNDFPKDIFSNKDIHYNYMEERTVEPFTKLSLKGNFDVTMIKSDTSYIRVETKENSHNHISINSDHGCLTVSSADFYRKKWHKSGKSKLTIYTTDLENLDLSGNVTFTCNDTLKPAIFDAEITGAGKVNILLNVPKAKFDLTGAGKVNIKGQADFAEFDVSGAGKVEAFDFVVNNMKVDISGAGKMDIHVNNSLQAEASGAAHIEYKGNPVVEMDKSGVVKIKKAD